MKVAELLKIGSEMMKTLHENGISISDYVYLPMLSEYEMMKRRGEKTTYAVMLLSKKYKLSERKIYKVFARLLKDCQTGAVG